MMNECRNNQCMTKARLRERIAAYDFALLEMNLFLDTHPDDDNALQMMDAYRQKRMELIGAYECRFGPYVVTAADVSGDRWSWVDDPWPWECTGKE